jgi:ribonucleoside-triphosphate reductase
MSIYNNTPKNIEPFTRRFDLSESTKSELKRMTPEFGFNGLGEVVFRRTYSRGNEDWADVVIRVTQGSMSIRKEHYFRSSLRWIDSEWETFAHDMAISLFKMEWLPPGRGLWMMGTDFVYERGSMALNNCFREDTKFWTYKGLKSFSDFDDGDSVMVRGRNKWLPATIKCFGEQELVELTIQKGGVKQTIFTTEKHRWLLDKNSKLQTTDELEKGCMLENSEKYNPIVHCTEMSNAGIQHGIVYSRSNTLVNSKTADFELFGSKKEELSKFFTPDRTGITLDTQLPVTWKNLPSINMTKDYFFGFLAGWFANYGRMGLDGRMSISNSSKKVLEWLRDALFKIDIKTHPVSLVCSLPIDGVVGNPLYELYFINDNIPIEFFICDSQLSRFKAATREVDSTWEVVNVKNTGIVEKVWCVVEPNHEEFTLDCGILTKNCSATDTKDDLVHSAEWTMDGLMNGVGVGFSTNWRGTAAAADKTDSEKFFIPDSREGWVESLIRLMCAYIDSPRYGKNKFPVFDYSLIREKGLPIKGFGGQSSGSEPLIKMHKRIEGYLDAFCAGELIVPASEKTEWSPATVEVRKTYSHTRLVADIFNSIGSCVVAGNVRRSAEIALGDVDDDDFINLKNYTDHPERSEIGWMSNNSVTLKPDDGFDDFSYIPDMAKRIIDNGEPGMINLYNIQKYGRYGKDMKDDANLCNPCGEIPLCNFELCNLSEVFPNRCQGLVEFNKALKFATFYSTSVSLLPTHRPETNAVIARNRRIGVSISGIAQWVSGAAPSGWGLMNYTRLTRILREGYQIVRNENTRLAKLAGVPESIRVTTIKPSGSISLLAGATAGVHYPVSRYVIRRVRIGADTPLVPALKEAGIPYEPDKYSDGTLVFEFTVDHGDVRSAEEVSPWEQFCIVAMLQRCWADNMVSATVMFDKEKDAADVEKLLAMFIPVLKSVSMLPHTGHGYAQAPYEPITAEEYEKRKAAYSNPKFDNVKGSVPDGSKFCDGDSCVL